MFHYAKENVTDGLAEQRERPIHTMAALSTDRADQLVKPDRVPDGVLVE